MYKQTNLQKYAIKYLNTEHMIYKYHEYIYSFTGCSFQNRKYFSFHALSYLQFLYITQVLKIQNMLVQFHYFIRITFL